MNEIKVEVTGTQKCCECKVIIQDHTIGQPCIFCGGVMVSNEISAIQGGKRTPLYDLRIAIFLLACAVACLLALVIEIVLKR